MRKGNEKYWKNMEKKTVEDLVFLIFQEYLAIVPFYSIPLTNLQVNLIYINSFSGKKFLI